MSWMRSILGGMLVTGVALLAPMPLVATPLASLPLPPLSVASLPVPTAAPMPVPALAPARSLRPMARGDIIPDARWDSRPDGAAWSLAALRAINSQPDDLSSIVPRDIVRWCPAYPQNPDHLRDAFWVGMMSALARHESTFNPAAVGGGGRYFGLLQIYPATARSYGCAATTGQALTDPAANLACAVTIMARTVARDGAVALHDGRWRGVAADWGPMTMQAKREEMAEWTRSQDYCAVQTAVTVALRPPARPWTLPASQTAQAAVPDVDMIELAMLATDVRELRAIP